MLASLATMSIPQPDTTPLIMYDLYHRWSLAFSNILSTDKI
jgi:hypothetical protein